jgi:hypothetical protein
MGGVIGRGNIIASGVDNFSLLNLPGVYNSVEVREIEGITVRKMSLGRNTDRNPGPHSKPAGAAGFELW